ncbi:MAG: DUF3857 domain-containing protein [Candidatus Zixiibacteriota bacterium]
MMYCRATYILLFCTLIFLCVVPDIVFSQEWGKISEEEWDLKPPSDFPNAEAIIVFDNGVLTTSVLEAEVKLERHTRIKIFNCSRAEDIIKIEIPYLPDDKIRSPKAYTNLPNGKKIKVKSFQKIIDADGEKMVFSFPDVTDGSIIEYSYTYTHKRVGYFKPWYFQNSIFTLQSKLIFTFGPNARYSWVYYNEPDYFEKSGPQDITLSNGYPAKQYCYIATNVPPANPEPLMPGYNYYRSHIVFQMTEYFAAGSQIDYIKSWRDIGSLVENWLDQKTSHCLDEWRRIGDSICDGLIDNQIKTINLFDNVNGSIAKLDGQEWTGDLCDLINNRTAGPSEKNVFLINLLKSQGIESYPIYIGTRDYIYQFYRNFQDLNQLNRIVCYIGKPGKGFILDAGENVLFPLVPSYDLVASGLLINDRESCIIDLDLPEIFSERRYVNYISLSGDGAADCSTHVLISGCQTENFMHLLNENVSNEELGRQLLAGSMFLIDISDASRSETVDGSDLHFKAFYNIPQFSNLIEDEMIFLPNIIQLQRNLFKNKKRYYPIDFRYKYGTSHKTIITIPEEYQVASIPKDISEQSWAAAFERKVKFENGSIVIDAELLINHENISANNYKHIKGVFDAMTEAGFDEVILRKKK